MKNCSKRASGFSMIELLLATLIFTVIAGSIFSVLLSSQIRYQSDSGLTSVYQQANLVMDQITRDIHSAGFPPPFSSTNNIQQYFAVAFPWSPGYPNTPACLVGACTSPAPYDLLLESDTGDGNGVEWIRYVLDGTTLRRGIALKQANTDPLSQLDISTMPPYLENVVNQNNARAIFSYAGAPGKNVIYPTDIFEVNVCLVVQSLKPDPQTGKPRTITVTGQAVRFNPNQ